MVFSSLTFLFYFLPITLILYFLSNNINYKNFILLIASLIFYAWGEPKYILLIIFSTLVDYLLSNIIQNCKDAKEDKKQIEKLALFASIAINLSLLIFFKYSGFIAENVSYLTAQPNNYIAPLLPIGISFYTFQTMSYTIDVYRGEVRAQRNFLTLATYISLFPQLIAGPIVRYQTIEKELVARKGKTTELALGLRRFIWGLGKKVLIANQMGLIADTIYQQGERATLVLWLAALAYTFQIYYDFSGYSDMAIGIGKMLGFNFLENFDQPYTASSITDFWQRWHISLSSWFKDYLYIPLGGNRKHQMLNIIIVWAMTGLWHGASWNFMLWGLYYALLLIIEKNLKHYFVLPQFLARIVTFIIVLLGWTIFRLEDFTLLNQTLYYMFHYQAFALKDFLIDYSNIIYALPFFIPALLSLFKHQKNSRWLNYGYSSDLGLLIIFAFSISFLFGSSFNPFIYFRF